MKFLICIVVCTVINCSLNGEVVSADPFSRELFSKDPYISISSDNVVVKPGDQRSGLAITVNTLSTQVRHACSSESRKGLCIETEESCEKQEGEFYGYCYVSGIYSGVCCLGLDPEKAVFSPPAHPIHDLPSSFPTAKATTAAPTFPEFPSPPTFPPVTAPNMSLPSPPTFPSVTAPNMSLPSPPTFPPVTAPNMSLPSPPTFPSVTAPNMSLPSPPTFPPVTAPNMSLPSPPTFPPVTAPNMSLPSPPTFPPVTAPNMSLPSPPTFPPVTAPNMSLPSPPTFPSVTAPNMSLPSPPTFPPVTAPNISLPSPPTVPSLPPMPSLAPDTSTAATQSPATPSPTETTAATTAVTAASSVPPPAAEAQVISPPSESIQLPSETQVVESSPSCGISTSEVESYFSNPSYPSLDTESKVYQYVVLPKEGYTALRIDVREALLAGRSVGGCNIDYLQILNTADGPTASQCGFLQGYQYTVYMVPHRPVTILVTTQSAAYMWNIRVKQIKGSKIPNLQDYQSKVCGNKNQGAFVRSNLFEDFKTVPTERLLKPSKQRTLSEISSENSAFNEVLKAGIQSMPDVRIYRGNETGVNEWPWQALILLNGHPICGASIISEQYLITAGHCTQLSLDIPLVSLMTVDVGDHDLRTLSESKNVVMRVSRIIPHASYQQTHTSHRDIALIKLVGKLNLNGHTIRPVCLPTEKDPEETYSGKTATTTGWGRTEESVISPVLREANVSVISQDQCKAGWESLAEGAGIMIEDGMVCVDGGDSGPCNGDSGGPLVTYEEEKWRLIGLTSFGSLKGCAAPGIPSVYTRITSYLKWIAANLAE